jgi:molybdopterin-guanine dinucleotide biosynthesis protein A
MVNVFLSHRATDLAEACRLRDALQERRYEVWLDADQMRVGDSIVGKMNDGLSAASHLVLCLSSSGVDAPWISREWLSALARQLEGRGIKVLPVRLTGSEAPAILADIKYADLVADWGKGLEDLCAALQ